MSPRKETLTIRISPDLKTRVADAIEAMPYRPTVTAIVERGLELALLELERMSQAKGGAE